MKFFSSLIVSVLFCGSAFAKLNLETVSGLKAPNDSQEGTEPVVTSTWAYKSQEPSAYPGYSELIPFFLRSPNQLEAGSCLYMSLTGIAEFWMARLNPTLSRAPEGPLDLSERHFMNIAGLEESGSGVADWKTDSIYLLNRAGALARNANYRFTKGWAKKNATGDYVRAVAGTPGSAYGTKLNWVDDTRSISPRALVKIPFFSRDVIFADPASDQWNVGVMPPDIVERIKTAMLKRRAPVHVIYNHFGYWHAVDIIGFDDAADSMKCAFVTKFMTDMRAKPATLRAQAARAATPEQRANLLAQAARTEKISMKADAAFTRGGGCHPKGMFYVRDSIYSDTKAPAYDYDISRNGEESPYTKLVVLHEYDWIRYLANHVTQIYVK